ncbi:MAG TPA: DNA mismatch repair protein MutH [Gammaproteobacteria bacterium]|nr:DNA mismatch repair protein MutH [Gammaproteobacteria bacterium]
MMPPRDEAELLARALAIAGMPLASLATRAPSTRHKGWSGETIERALGVPDSNYAGPDFPALGIELKTIPVDSSQRPLESTHVCTLNPHEDTTSDWPRSRVRAKLARVLWIPLLVTVRNDPASRIVGQALLWSPTAAEEARLKADWEELMERVACGRLEETTARIGEWLQLRPKAAHGRITAAGHAADGTPEAQLPRGFYLRPAFTARLLARHYLQRC